MKSIFFISFLACFLVSAGLSAQDSKKDSSCGATSGLQNNPKNDTLVLLGRCVEIPGRFVPNNAYNYVYIMKYRVIKVDKGTCSDRVILVGHYNPLIPRSLIKDKMDTLVDGTLEVFAEGDRHRLTLVRPLDNIWNGPVETEYYDTDLETYFAIKADNAD